MARLSIWAGMGALLLVMAWLLPAHWKSLAPSVIKSAGRGTSTLESLGQAAVVAEKPGPAQLILASAQSLNDPQAAKLAAALADLTARKPELVARGGHDRFLDSILKPAAASAKPASVPVVEMFLPEPVRESLRQHLGHSTSPGARAILQTTTLTGTTRFVPATWPGGQPFDAVILMLGCLYEGGHLMPSLEQELKTIADKASQPRTSDEWERTSLDWLALGMRLNWTQLAELLRFVPDLKTVAALARIAKDDAERFPLVYSASLMSQSPDGVTKYLARFGQPGMESLATAVTAGESAVRLILRRQLPIGPPDKGALAFMAPWSLRAPNLVLGLKLVGFALAIGCFYFIWLRLAAVERIEGLSGLSRALHWRRAAIAAALVLLMAAASEPLLLQKLAGSELKTRLSGTLLMPSLSLQTGKPETRNQSIMHLDTSTILSVALFAALQVVVYAICLLKVREIDQQPGSSALKLRLMENEENLFDSGLYVGISGTAAALVLQVLQIIEANLLAAYASNLFGIICVALVKIRHVRAYKRKLIVQAQGPTEAAPQRQPLIHTQPAI